MASTLLIIDAMNLIRRIYAIQEKQHADIKKALEITTHTACNALQKLIYLHHPTHVICVFDSHAPSWRHQIYAQYKHGRKPIPPALKAHLENIQDSFFDIGIESLVTETDEADDLIATLATKMAKNNQKSIIVSTDKGFYQLLNKQILIYDYFQNSYTDEGRVLNKMSLPVEKLTDFWAITGISSSAIKGVDGVGEKGALALLHDYNTLQGIFDSPINEKDKRLSKVKNNEQEARLAKTLVTLKSDIPLGFNLQDLRYQKTS
ncbi:flap endonuclease Xni [Psychromonas sp. Urea-02u-13]|uniref:flap endonuclease Xni n=1 Tax=Psychromonas sp. Urea-02u-13 TaxID=2058326 RepID=UPI000C336091|nr:flap endonuclease Xni [Psychromonas sp. Urea-02u-13]PKG38511.1 flap endonuclease Xni [Psychromonas sp. Urea-02u-13]